MTFTSAEQGTPEAGWQAWGGLGRLALLDPPARTDRLVVVAAHPDDETLGAGGLLATAAAVGALVHVVVATCGEGSHPGSPSTTPDQLRATRRAEVLAAVAALAPQATVHLLGLPDGALAGHAGELRERLGELCAPGCWIAAPWRGDAHPDHASAGAVAAEVAADVRARLLEYPIWAWHWASPGDARLPWPSMRALPLGPGERARKGEAIAAHASQVRALSAGAGDEPVLPPHVLAHFERPAEVFVETDHRARPASLAPEDFERFYAGSGHDPWGFTDRWYEQRKRALTLAVLPRPRFRRAFEAGCSIGVLTAELAPRCDELLAWDVALPALALARERTAGLPQVRVERGRVPHQWPAGQLDLVVLSEVGYYCGTDDLALLVERAAAGLADDGVLVACHWRHAVAGYPLRGDVVHEALAGHPRLTLLARHEEEDFLLDVLVPGPAVSVARATGLVP